MKANGSEVEVSARRGKDKGRGCYVCPNEKCMEAALRPAVVSRALRRQILVVPSKEKLLSRARIKGVTE